MVLQLGDVAYRPDRVDEAISHVTLKMGSFLQENYQTIADAGRKTGLLSKEELDNGLRLIGGTMGVELIRRDPQVGEPKRNENVPDASEEVRPAQEKQEAAAGKEELPGEARQTITDAAKVLKENAADLMLSAGEKHVAALLDTLNKIAEQEYPSEAERDLDLRNKAAAFLNCISAEDLRDTAGAKACAAAGLSAMSALLPPEEVQQGCDILNAKLGLGPCDKDCYAADKFVPGFEKGETALTYIDNCKRGIVDDDTAREKAANIFAARIAVDTKGGKAAYLKTPLSETQTALAAEELKKNRNFRDWLGTLDRKKVRDLLNGHGGQMMEDIRNYYNEMQGDRKVSEIINENTVDTRIEKLEEEAEALRPKLQSENRAEREAALKQSRRVLGEYIGLSKIPEEKAAGDMPWKAANAAARSGERSELIQAITGNAADAEKAMKAVSERNNGVFSQLLIDKVKEGKIKETDLKPQVMEEARRQPKLQQEETPDTEEEDLLMSGDEYLLI